VTDERKPQLDQIRLLAEAVTLPSAYTTRHPHLSVDSGERNSEVLARAAFVERAQARLETLELAQTNKKLDLDMARELLLLRSYLVGAEGGAIAELPAWQAAPVSDSSEPPSATITLPRETLEAWYVRFAAFTITDLPMPDQQAKGHALLIEIAEMMALSPEGWGES
jgi:hypothetical protein